MLNNTLLQKKFLMELKDMLENDNFQSSPCNFTHKHANFRVV